jgi:tetratricopeptide (TPR) repeat protein
MHMPPLPRAPRRALRIAGVIVAALALLPNVATARTNESTNWTEEDFALYPPYCRARLLREPKELEAYWSKQLGPKNFLHMHHFCFGLKALNLAYGNLRDKQRMTGQAYTVVRNFNYILEQTQRDFYLRPEALLNIARGYALLQEFKVARDKFEEALKLNPKLVDAWVGLSDMYYQNGQRADALRVLEKALEVAGEHKKITLRIEDMKKQGVK